MIDCKNLLDLCWHTLNKKYEEVYGQQNYGYSKPEFTFVLSHEEIIALRLYVANIPSDEKVFVGIENQMLFGHPLTEQKRTPYLESIIVTKEG